jgi:hypothetical protein
MNTATAKGGSLRALNLHGELVAMMIIYWWLSVCKLWHLKTASGAKSHQQLETTKRSNSAANEKREEDGVTAAVMLLHGNLNAGCIT